MQSKLLTTPASPTVLAILVVLKGCFGEMGASSLSSAHWMQKVHNVDQMQTKTKQFRSNLPRAD